MTHPVPAPPFSGENLLMDDDDVILLTDEILPAEDDGIIELRELADPSEMQDAMKLPDPANGKAGLLDLSDVLEESDFKTERLTDLSLSEAETLDLDFDQTSDPFLLDPKMPVEDSVPLDDFHGDEAVQIQELAAIKDSDTDDSLVLSNDMAPPALKNEFAESLNLSVEPARESTFPTSGTSKSPDSTYQMDDLQQLIHEVVHDSQVPRRDLPGIHSAFDSTEKAAAMDQDLPADQTKDDLLDPTKDKLGDQPKDQPKDQMDAAVERVIRDLYAERIEQILDEVVTTTVTREIEKLKTVLLDYLASGQTADKIKS